MAQPREVDEPPEGYVVRDSSFNVMLAAGTTLHGEYGGDGRPGRRRRRPAGIRRLQHPDPGSGGSGNDQTIDIRFSSTGPIVANADGVMTFVCDLESEQWGSGQVRGIVTGSNGEIRNVLTFPAGA